MPRALAYLGQAVIYALIALCLGSFATSPAHRPFPDGKAQLLLSFSHGGQRKGACRKLSREEIAEMAANMRRAELCPRERLPVTVELALSGEVIYRAELPPTGLSGDGASQAYQSFMLEPGSYEIAARLRDSARGEGFDYEDHARVVLAPGQRLAIDFRSAKGGFIFGTRRAGPDSPSEPASPSG